jgi:L-fuconolactonase
MPDPRRSSVIVDAHHHLWTADYPWLAGPGQAAIRRDYTVADLVPHLDAAGVTATVLVEAGRHTAAETAWFLAEAQRTPRIAGVVGWASLTDPDLAGTVARYRELPGAAKLVGIRGEAPDAIDFPGPAGRALAAIGAAGLPYDLLVHVGQLPAVAQVAQAHPGTTFVLDHLGGPRIGSGAQGLAQWRAAVAGPAARDNVVAKLSGMLTGAGPGWSVAALRPYVDAALELFGPSRLMIGSDWPVVELVGTYDDALATVRSCLDGLSVGERADVEGGTAIRTYGLRVVTADRCGG